MHARHLVGTLGCATLLAFPVALRAQYTTPNLDTTSGDVVTVHGSNLFVNHGLVGVGRLPPLIVDGETFGSVSGLQITEWVKIGANSYAGTFNILPDRGYNSGTFFSDYAARIQRVTFAFTPYTGATNIGGTDIAQKIAAQNQIFVTSVQNGEKFKYFDAVRQVLSETTGLDPDTGLTTLFSTTVPYVVNYTGKAMPASALTQTYTGVNKLPIDAEALVLKADGSGYIGDEYGANVYYFNASKQIVGVIGVPEALRPRRSLLGSYYFGGNTTGAAAPPATNPTEGRRINQGFEGVALSPDGSRLFVLLQSAAVQDTSGNNSTRRQTRLLVYNVSAAAPTPGGPTAEYALTLPTYRTTGNGGAVDATAAQSEVVALDDDRLLVLSRDGNGLGNSTSPGLPSVYKSVLLVDLTFGCPTSCPTNIAGTSRDNENGKITTSAGVLDPLITPVTTREVLNLLNTTQLGKFNIELDLGLANQVSQLTLSEKWEGMALVPANDPLHPNDYFLFIANDNDFLTSAGTIKGPGLAGGVYMGPAAVSYDGFDGYDPKRQPINGGIANSNDTMFLAYRVTSVFDPDPPVLSGLPTDCAIWPPNHKMVRVATISASDLSGIVPGSFTVTAVSDEPQNPGPDVAVTPDGSGGFDVQLRADRSPHGNGRTYTITASVTDLVGHVATATASCVVPHDQGKVK